MTGPRPIRGRIVNVHHTPGSGIAEVEIVTPGHRRRRLPADAAPLFRALRDAGNEAGLRGRDLLFTLDEVGILTGFTFA